MVSVCLPSDALSQCLPSYLGFSYLGRGVSLHSCSSKAQPLLFTLDEGYLLTAAPPDLEREVAPLGHRAASIPRAWGGSSTNSHCQSLAFFAWGTRGLYSITHMLQSIFQKKKSMHPAVYVIQQLPTVSHMVVCVCQSYYLNSSHAPLHLLSPQVHSVHLPLYSNLIIFLTSDNCHWINSSH